MKRSISRWASGFSMHSRLGPRTRPSRMIWCAGLQRRSACRNAAQSREGRSRRVAGVGCEDLTDEELLAAFEACALPKERFHHGDHIRLAWLYTGRYGPAEAERRFLAGIRRLAEHFGAPRHFITRRRLRGCAWSRR